MRIALYIIAILGVLKLNAQPVTDAELRNILSSSGNHIVDSVLRKPQDFRVQVIYTRIDRDRNNVPAFKNFYFNYDPGTYFNPASMVKMPLAFLALEKLNQLHQPINKHTTIYFDSSHPGQKILHKDTTAFAGLPTIAHMIRRAFLISENDPYNRLYQFVGQGEINRKLWEKGYKQSRITRMFMGFTPEQNRHTNAIRFLNPEGKVIYTQPAAYNKDSFDFSRVIKLGKAYMNRNDSIINEPFDFTMHNNLPLEDMQQMLQSVIFPLSVPQRQRFDLEPEDHEFLLRYLSQYPSETPYPKYDSEKFYDSYVKFFFTDSSKKMPAGVRVFNKVGWAYGFMTDVSYVADFNNQIEYMLSATVYVNSDGVLNDGKYDYDTVGSPFMYHIGQAIYQHELKRKRKHVPDLSALQLKYENRDPRDTRPSIKEVDN